MMTNIKRTSLAVVLVLTVSCAALTRHHPDVEWTEFQGKFAILNYQIRGELKRDNPALDLTTLQIKDYYELTAKVARSEDIDRVVDFIKNHASEQKLIFQKDTFVICLRSLDRRFVLWDDAKTPDVDKVRPFKPGESVPTIEDFCAELSSGAGNANPRR
jgi:hypothetical protein